MAKYKVLVGIDYPPHKRAEVGDVVDDLPGGSVKWLVEGGYIESIDEKPAKKAKAVEDKPEAADGDAEGLVQDGTVPERPADPEDN